MEQKYNGAMLSLEDLISEKDFENSQEYKDIRRDLIKELYPALELIANENLELAKKEGCPYKDGSGQLWIPLKFKNEEVEREGAIQNAWVQLFKEGTEVKIYDDTMTEEIEQSSKLKLSSFHKLFRHRGFLEKVLKVFDGYGFEPKNLIDSKMKKGILTLGLVGSYVWSSYLYVAKWNECYPDSAFPSELFGEKHLRDMFFYTPFRVLMTAAPSLVVSILYATGVSVVQEVKRVFTDEEKKYLEELKKNEAIINSVESSGRGKEAIGENAQNPEIVIDLPEVPDQQKNDMVLKVTQCLPEPIINPKTNSVDRNL
jgi:hypothetical protein